MSAGCAWRNWRKSPATLFCGLLAVVAGFIGIIHDNESGNGHMFVFYSGVAWSEWRRLPDVISLNVLCATTARNSVMRCSSSASTFLTKMQSGRLEMDSTTSCSAMTGVILRPVCVPQDQSMTRRTLFGRLCCVFAVDPR